MRLATRLGRWLLAPGCEHRWVCTRVRQASYRWTWAGSPLVSYAHERCERCGKLRVREREGWWTADEINGER